MDTLHTVLRSIRSDAAGEAKGKAAANPPHLNVFREFLAHLEKINRPAPRGPARIKPASTKMTSNKTRRKTRP